MIERLIKMGAGVNAQGSRYRNALYAAVIKRQKGAIKILLKSGAKPDTLDADCFVSPLRHGDREVIQILKGHGAGFIPGEDWNHPIAC